MGEQASWKGRKFTLIIGIIRDKKEFNVEWSFAVADTFFLLRLECVEQLAIVKAEKENYCIHGG